MVSTQRRVTVARCSAQGMQQYNGTYGCGWCQQQTVGSECSSGAADCAAARVYPFSADIERRTNTSVIQCAKDASEKDLFHYKGVKHVSPPPAPPRGRRVDKLDSFACRLYACSAARQAYFAQAITNYALMETCDVGPKKSPAGNLGFKARKVRPGCPVFYSSTWHEALSQTIRIVRAQGSSR